MLNTDSEKIKENNIAGYWGGQWIHNWPAYPDRTIGLLGVAINSLGKSHLVKIRTHLLALDDQDRFMRFGYTTTDEHIDRYIASLNFERDDIYGIFNTSMELAGLAHLALPKNFKNDQAEFGVSVLKKYRGKGYGNKLFERASIHATNNKIKHIYIQALSENGPMLKIARKHGAIIHREGSETEALVSLAKPSIDSHMSELISEQYAKTNYDVRAEIKKFWDFMTDVQKLNKGVNTGRHKSSAD